MGLLSYPRCIAWLSSAQQVGTTKSYTILSQVRGKRGRTYCRPVVRVVLGLANTAKLPKGPKGLVSTTILGPNPGANDTRHVSSIRRHDHVPCSCLHIQACRLYGRHRSVRLPSLQHLRAGGGTERFLQPILSYAAAQNRSCTGYLHLVV